MTDTFLTITPLGGLGEIGMNCQMWNTPEGCVLVDCGIMFPDDQQLGVDVVIPPLEPILAQRGRLLGVVLTHGHEDHIGSLAGFFYQGPESLRLPHDAGARGAQAP